MKGEIKVERVARVREVTSEGITSGAVDQSKCLMTTIRWITRTGG
jgi:hypothetical protein